jgi:Formate hydrogenlyase subunit 4
MIDFAWFNPIVAFCVGILLSFSLRKVVARVQSRRGPLLWLPRGWHYVNRSKVLQPLYDILKLLSKQTFIPATSTPFFVLGPVLAFLFAIALPLFIPVAGISIGYEFSLVVIFYLLIGVIMSIIIGGTASASLFAAIGGVREIELMLANEIPFILGCFALAVWYDTLSVTDMMGPNLLLNPFAAAAFFVAMLAKLHVKPFDISEAESEIVGGLTTEYSGKLLGLLEITKVVMLFSLAALFVDLFLWTPLGWAITGVSAWALFLAGVFVVSVALGVVQALFARFRIDQATRWLFTVSTALGVISLLWAVVWRFVL